MEELEVSGMTCVNCANSLNHYLERIGMEDVSVNFATHEVVFENPKKVDYQTIKAGIGKLGFEVVEAETKPNWWTMERKFWIALAFTLPLFLHHIFMMLAWNVFPFLNNSFVQLAFCLPVYSIGFWFFGKSGWASLRNGSANMDVLIFLGSTAAFVYSLIGTFGGNEAYIFYETAATIITLVLLGNLIEHKSVEKTTTAISELSKLKPEKALKILASGAIIEIKATDLQIGDKLKVNEGDKIPTDGRLIKGFALLDESMLTGESLPVEKKRGENLIGSSILTSGTIEMRVSAIGKQTVLSQIIDLVKSAQQDKPDIQRLADKISAIFVPVVSGIALLTFLVAYFGFGISGEQSMMRAIAVLVISCPCAMGLATPTAVMVGVGRAAKEGILIKGGQTLELFSKIQKIVFDKTGTLTTGHFQVDDIQYYNNKQEKIDTLIYSMEQHSSHPIAQSLVQIFKQANTIIFKKVEEKKGLGIIAIDELGDEYVLGSKKILPKNTDFPKGHSIFLIKNKELLASLSLKDEVKKDAKATIQYFNTQGINTLLLSGDTLEKVTTTAQYLGIKHFEAEKSPEEKVIEVKAFSKKEIIAMVGDGINDAPALAQAQIGVSMGNASPVAIQSAQLILMNGSMSSLNQAHHISTLTVKTIKENLFWAFAYNIVAIPIAALGFLTPMWGALFMAFSDVVVIGNSIRLKKRK